MGSDGPPLRLALPVFGLLAFLGNAAGSALRYPEVGAAVLFPPYAVLTAALVVSPVRAWGWFILVGALAHFVTHWPHWSLSWVLLADVANVARAVTAAVLLRRVFPGGLRLVGVGALLRFVAAAVIAAPAVGATLGAASVVLHGGAPTYWGPWTAWFLSNAVTGLTMLPALALVFERLGHRGSRVRPGHAAEAVLLAVAVAASCAMAFLPRAGPVRPAVLAFYLPLPALVWAALRFGSGGTSLALSGVAFAAIWGADRATGPFLSFSPDDNMITVQVFMLVTTLPLLCLAAVNEARQGLLELYGALLSSRHDHVALLDAHGIVLDVNDSWRRCAKGPGGDPLRGLGAGDDSLSACRAAAVGGDTTAQRALAGLVRVLSREESRFEMEYDDESPRQAFILTVEALERADGGAVVTRSDVTARREAHLEIEEQRRELARLGRVTVLGQLSGALAHELNQPLAAIMSNADAARRLLAREPLDGREVAEALDDIVGEGRRAADVIRGLRAFYQRGETRRQALDAEELVGKVLELAHSEMVIRRVTLKAQLEHGLPAVQADRVQMQQVLLNLVLNACEAVRSSEPGDRVVTLSARADDGHVHFEVGDRGTGIAPDLLDRLFEPFVTTKPDGLGLGLSISRTIVAAHGGRLWAENNTGPGATVHCVIPRSA